MLDKLPIVELSDNVNEYITYFHNEMYEVRRITSLLAAGKTESDDSYLATGGSPEKLGTLEADIYILRTIIHECKRAWCATDAFQALDAVTLPPNVGQLILPEDVNTAWKQSISYIKDKYATYTYKVDDIRAIIGFSPYDIEIIRFASTGRFSVVINRPSQVYVVEYL